MIKLITAILIATTFSGCIYQVADRTDIIKATEFCEDKLGVKEIRIGFVGDEKVTCINGASKDLSDYKLKMEK